MIVPRWRNAVIPGIDQSMSTEIIDTVHARRPPMIPVDATLRL